jgi:hypothetical protein
METTRDTCAQTAKRIRKALKTAFPGVKFSVRSKTYSGGASINVGWDFGPTEKEVSRIAKRFESSTFDGMIDLKSSLPPTLFSNEDGTFSQISFGADYVFCDRGYGGEEEKILRTIAKKAGEVFADVEYSETKALYQQEAPGRSYDLGGFARGVLAHSPLPDGFHGVKENENPETHTAENLLKAY